MIVPLKARPTVPVATTRATVTLEPAAQLSGTRRLDADLHATASWYSFGAGLDYNSASDDMHSLSASLSIGETYFETHQKVVRVTDRNVDEASVDEHEAPGRCETPTCADRLMPQSVGLAQFMVDGSVTDTVDGDTDLSLDVSYYLYGDDPMKPGYVALATLQATTRGSATSAPLLHTSFTPSVTHRWGDLAASASLSYTGYARREFDVGANLSVEYKLALAGKCRLGLHARLGGQSHTDASYASTGSGSLALGAQYSW